MKGFVKMHKQTGYKLLPVLDYAQNWFVTACGVPGFSLPHVRCTFKISIIMIQAFGVSGYLSTMYDPPRGPNDTYHRLEVFHSVKGHDV